MSTITGVQGSSIHITATISLNGSPLNLTGLAKAWFTAKHNLAQTDPGDFQKTLASGAIIVTDAVNGVLTIDIAPADTIGLPSNGDLFWDLRIKTATGSILTVATGTLVLQNAVTLTTT